LPYVTDICDVLCLMENLILLSAANLFA